MPAHRHGMVGTSSSPSPGTAFGGMEGVGECVGLGGSWGISQQQDFGLRRKSFVPFVELVRKCAAVPAILCDGRMRNLNQKINLYCAP